MLLINFEKAFDSVYSKFIQEALEFFNFGPSFSKWIKIYQYKSISYVVQAVGCFLSNFFNSGRGY
jgi:hypothetical protein